MLGGELVTAVLTDFKSAPVDSRVKAMLTFLEKLTLTPDEMTKDDGRALKAAGITRADAEDAIWVAFQFAFFTRMADGLGFEIPTDGYVMAPQVLLSPIGYR